MQFYEQKESGPQLGILDDIIAEQAGGWSGPFPDTAAARLKVDQAGPGWARLGWAGTDGHAGLAFFFFQLVETFSEDTNDASSAN